MGDNSQIEWTDATWNPVRGCSIVSEGCRNCYAMRVAHRFSGEGQPYEGLTVLGSNGPRWNGNISVVEKHMLTPLRWQRPRMIFVNSMSDLWHEDVPEEVIDRVFAVMSFASQHTFQILTKRPERMLEYFTRDVQELVFRWGGAAADLANKGYMPHRTHGKSLDFNHRREAFLYNVWIGVSAEDQKTADERIPLLLRTPAKVRWVSAEPLLGPMNLSPYLVSQEIGPYEEGNPTPFRAERPAVDWVVAGGESGSGARPMQADWVRWLRAQCARAEVAFLFKQWGAHDADGQRVGKKAAGRTLDGATYSDYPSFIVLKQEAPF